MVETPHLTFFCELEAHALPALFHDPGVIGELGSLGAGVSLALSDLSAERAHAVQRLNEAGIAVTAWLLASCEQGYFFNLDNAPEAAAAYGAFKSWTAEHGLRWAAVGLDIEPDLNDMRQLQERPWTVLGKHLRQSLDGSRLRRGLAQYRDLVAQIRADGFPVESYEFPLMPDARASGSRLIERIFGVMDLDVDRKVYMLYSSLLRGPGALWSYGPVAGAGSGAIGIGSTGGGQDALPKLGWEELSRDLLLAHCWTDQIYVFSLEGCVQGGYLPRLAGFDWSRPVPAPFADARRVDALRTGLRVLLWLAAHPAALLAVPALALLGRASRRR